MSTTSPSDQVHALAQAAPGRDRLQPVRIVLVDDHQIVRDSLLLRLQQEADFTVVGTAGSAKEAWARVQQAAPDVVILDLHLPGESGLVIAARIRQTDPKVKIVMLTGDASASAPQEALRLGANGFVRKEDATEELVRAIRVVMTGKVYLSPDAATSVTQTLVTRPEPAEPLLSERETAVLKLMAEGLGYKEIASQLEVSPKSVETYRARMAKKTGCATRAELVRYAVRKGLVAA